MSVAAQDHPNQAAGFAPDRVYDFGGIENVNLLNGTLNLTIPIGPVYPVGGDLSYQLFAVYDSNLWQFVSRKDPVTGEEGVPAAPRRPTNAGLGWRVGLGELRFKPNAVDPH